MPRPKPEKFHKEIATAVFANLVGDPLLHVLHSVLLSCTDDSVRADIMRLTEQRAALVALAVASGDEPFLAVETTIDLPASVMPRLETRLTTVLMTNPIAAFAARLGRAPTYAECIEELDRRESQP